MSRHFASKAFPTGALRSGLTVLILAGVLGAFSHAGAATDTKKPAAPAKPAAKTAAKPAGSTAGGGAKTGPSAGGAKTGPSAGGAKTTTTPGAKTSTGPSANGRSGGPTANPTAEKAGGPAAGGTHGAPVNTSKSFGGRPAPPGGHETTLRSGSAIRTDKSGHVRDVHDAKRGMDVHHGIAGGRRVSVERADHSRLVAERGRRGYIERPYGFHGHDFGRRSYYYNGRSYDRYYRGYGYNGVYLNVYAPGYYYGPAFYGWAYNPWAVPIGYGWGWGGAPWYGAYAFYFQPYPVYPSAAFWLTDYIISQDLQAVYAAHAAAGEEAAAAAAGGPPVMTPEVKQMIADEVKAQLALENQEAGQNTQGQDADPSSSGIARLLTTGLPHVFVAGGNLDVTDASGQECAVSDGDALELTQAPASNATAASLVVLSSKGAPECHVTTTVQVQLTDLQEMQNHMRETIDQGLQDLQTKQGKGGLPTAPPSAQAPPVQAQYASAAPPPETNIAGQIQQTDQQGEQAEKDVAAEAAQTSGGASAAAAPIPPPAPVDPAPAAAPASVEVGQTSDQVKASLGAPARIANLGPKIIYYYNGMKVTFKDGKVSDVQ
jgi:hypothetical protein